MTARRLEPHALAGAYALDALVVADRNRFERHLVRCEQCAREISGLREAAARLATAAAAEPPDGFADRVLAAAAVTRQLLPARPPHRPRGIAAPGPDGRPPDRRRPDRRWPERWGPGSRAGRRLRRALLPALATALAVATAVLAVNLGLTSRNAQHQLRQDQLRDHAIAAVLTAGDATVINGRVTTGGIATVVMSSRERALVFTAAGLHPLPRSWSYELWLMGAGGDKPAGMLPAPKQGMTGPVLATGLRTGDRLGLTVEPAAGASRPTTAMILVLAL